MLCLREKGEENEEVNFIIELLYWLLELLEYVGTNKTAVTLNSWEMISNSSS